MLLWIDQSVLTADFNADHEACAGISSVFDAHYRGEHYAIASRQTLVALSQCTSFSVVTKKVIESVLSNFSTLGAISSQVNLRLQVTHGKATLPTRISPAEWEIPLNIIGIQGIQKAVLLTENLEDATAYEHAAKQYLASLRMPGQVSLEKSGGGGSTTPDAFENHTRIEKRWCLCVTDSDRLYPGASMDSTARKCHQIADDQNIVASHIDLAAREIENIIPLTFLSEVIPKPHQALWEWHVDRLLAIRPDAHSYSDIKNGTTRKKIASYPHNTPKRAYWESVVRDLEGASALPSECVNGGNCQDNDENKCMCFVTHGFGEKLLELVNKRLADRASHQSETMIRRDSNQAGWLEIGKYVFEWCCSPKKMRL